VNVLDLFSGIGGFSLGLERAGMKTVAFCEVDKKCQQVLKKHWADVPIFNDVTTLSSKDLHETIDLICGGFPCQDISLAGKGAGLAGERSGLWWQFHRLIKEIKPKYVIAENVAALRSRGLDEVLRSLSEVGYDAEWHCIPASAVGAPHRRDRVWIVAYPRYRGWRDISSIKKGNNAQTKRTSDTNKVSRPSEQSSFVSNSDSTQCQGRSLPIRILTKNTDISCNSWWEIEPDVGRVVDGFPGRMDRLKQLGNAVVPQIPEIIGKAIMKVENDCLFRL